VGRGFGGDALRQVVVDVWQFFTAVLCFSVGIARSLPINLSVRHLMTAKFAV
jgi:hypothetical protein